MPKLTVVTKIESGECPIRSVLDRVGDKWSVLIFVAQKDEAKRFKDQAFDRRHLSTSFDINPSTPGC